ncbi:diguanylate cyclase [Candidatus Obscuribacterales bacterium]|nr:diguanylate cyclase [Candidatus Obscuribacterales bacterium]
MADSKIIFVVSNDADWLDLESLQGRGCQHVRVPSGFEALNEIKANGADLVVAESDLPDIAGFQLSSLIKLNDQTSALPVVIVTPDHDREVSFWTRASHADHVLSRSEIKEAGFASTIEKALGKAKETEWSADKAKSLFPAEMRFDAGDVSRSQGSLLQVLLIERLVNCTVRNLSKVLEPRRQFLDAYHQTVGGLFGGDVIGLVVADQENPWISLKANGTISAKAYERVLTEILSKLQITSQPHVDIRSEVSEEGSDIEDFEILPVPGDGSGIGAIFFGSFQKKEYDWTAKEFMTQLQAHIEPVFKLLLARQEIETLHSREAYRANVDSLTGLYNLEFLVGFLQQQLLFSFRQRLPVGIAIIDVDELGKMNEEYGSDIGDVVLSGVAKRLLAVTRSSDLVARYGGDEFAVVLPNTDGAGAKVLGEKVRSDIEQVAFFQGKKGPKVTVSVGCASFNMEDLNPETILRDAKIALQRAKEEGRNKVAI